MSFVGDFIGDTIGGITGAKQQAQAAQSAANVQAQAIGQGAEAQREALAENRRQFDLTRVDNAAREQQAIALLKQELDRARALDQLSLEQYNRGLSFLTQAKDQVQAELSGNRAQLVSSQDRLGAERSRALTESQPYRQTALGSFDAIKALTGLNGFDAQQKAINEIEQGAGFQELVQQGENAILQNAAATGGLRSGNTQASLARFRPQMLRDAIGERLTSLGGITSLGLQQQQLADDRAANLTGAMSNIDQNIVNDAITRAGITSNLFGNLANLGQGQFANNLAGNQLSANIASNVGNTNANFAGLAGSLGQNYSNANMAGTNALATSLANQASAASGGILSQGKLARNAFGDALDLFGAFKGIGGARGMKGLF